MLEAIADGETKRETLAALADRGLRATQEQLQDALGVCQELNPIYRRLIKMVLDEVASIDKRIDQLNQEMANLLRPHEDQVKRLAEVPGLGVDSAQQIIAEVGATVATFPSEKHLSSWVGACPGDEESAEVNYSRRSPQGNRHMRRILNQAANAAAKRFYQDAKDLLQIGSQTQNLVFGRPVRSVEVDYDCPSCRRPGILVVLLHTDLSWGELCKEQVQTAVCDNGLCPHRGLLQNLKPSRVVLGSLNPVETSLSFR